MSGDRRLHKIEDDWSPRQRARFVRDYQNLEIPIAELAARFGIGRSYMTRLVKRLGLTVRPPCKH